MISKGYIKTEYGLIHYRTAGNENKPHLLLLHQTASSSVMYEAIMELLANDYFMFAPDTLGFGGSDFPQNEGSMFEYAMSLRDAAEKFGIENPFVFGHHTGASIAVEIEFNEQFARKMILSGPPYLTKEQKENFKAHIEAIEIHKDGSHLENLWKRLREKDENADIYLTNREFLLNLHAGERYHEAYYAVFNHEFEMQLAELNCPILVMAGDKDTLRDSLEPAYRVLKNGEMRKLEGNTYICDQSPDFVAEIIKEYFVS